MKIRFYLLIFIFLFLYIISLSAFNINYQGKLLDNDSRRVNTTADIIFSLYNVATSGTALWQETHNNVSVTNGLFNVELGTITPINLKFDNQYYLGININGAGELMPRIKINTIAYAFRSRYSDTAAYLEDNAGAAGRMTINDTLIISQNVIITDDGKIGVGTLTPSEQIEVTGNIKASGNVNAAAFIGDGAQLTNLGATTLVDGSVRSHHILNETIINDDISQTASISPTKIDTEALRLGDTQILFGLNAQKIGAGNVDNTEFNYLDGVMAPLQTQINALSEDTNGLLARVESLESDSHNTEQRLLVLESDSQNTELRLQDLESDSENTENRLLSLEADSQNTELRLQNLEADSTNAEN
ncbi:MAG TPA: hypothetical protein PLM75_11820, partial [bacterium]|nr:hypothetical protein [bacterium]